MLLVLLARNIFAPADNAVQGGAGDTGQPPAAPSVTATAAGRGDHKCDVPVAPDKAFSGEVPSDYQLRRQQWGLCTQ